MRDSFVATLSTMAKNDPNIVLITGDLGFGVLEDFATEFPKQFINAGVAEQSMMGMAAGLASTGKRVFVYSIGNFPTFRCLEQIRNDVCNMNNSVVIVAVGAGYAYGPQGYTHHAIEDIAVMRALPNMQILSPCDPIETEILTERLAKSRNPAYLRLGKSKEIVIHKENPTLMDGKFAPLADGDHGTIIFTGSVGVVAQQARELLSSKGIEVGLFSSPFVSNIDTALIARRASLGPIVIVEEHALRGGFGSAILESLSVNRVKADIRLIFSTQENLALIGDQNYLRIANGISVDGIIQHFLD
jgi:transketolase